MNSKNQQSKQENQHGHQNQVPKKGQNPNDPQNLRHDSKHKQVQDKGHQAPKQPVR
jgi:hypothetical protein